eukprot:gene26333-biopygen15886
MKCSSLLNLRTPHAAQTWQRIWWMFRHDDDDFHDHNMHGVFLHILADLLGSV